MTRLLPRTRWQGTTGTKATRDRVRHEGGGAYYFASLHNRASIDLHARFGFELVTKDFGYPRGELAREDGALFRTALR